MSKPDAKPGHSGTGPNARDGGVEPWERELVRKLASAALLEQRRGRRWGIFFKLLGFAYLTAMILLWLPEDLSETVTQGKHTAVVDVTGLIGPGQQASADNVIEGLRDAFKDKHTKGMILRINSPGGSPVQAGYIYDEVRRLKAKHKSIPVYAVCADICASGAYYVAAAADKIYVSKASLVGSIGVLINSFGFSGAMEKLGIDRRLLTAGDHKGLFDPFSPLRQQDADYLKGVLEELHGQFVSDVKKGRGTRLKDSPELFSGLIWSGEHSVELGLADGFGSSDYVARELVKAEKTVDFTVKEDLFKRLAKHFGTSAGEAIGAWAGALSLPSLR